MMNDIEEMDRLFRETDFAAENPNLQERLRQKVWAKLVQEWQETSAEMEDEIELTKEELLHLAAAGNYYTPIKDPTKC